MSSGEAPVQAQAAGQRQKSWLSSLPLIVILLTIAATAIREPTDPDLWWHLATGRYIVAHRSIPVQDVFSYSAGANRWVTHEWLADLLLYGGYRLVGLGGLVVLFAVVIVAAFALVHARCHGSPLVVACSVLLAAVASTMTWGVRPQMFSLLFASLYLYILETDRTERSARVWLLPPLTMLWANLHSGFVTGLAIMAALVIGEELSYLGGRAGHGPWLSPRAGRLALVTLASLACSLVTPNGLSAALFPFGTLSNRLIQSNVEEWFSPDFHQPWAWALAVYWLALLAVLAASRRRAGVSTLMLLLGAGAAALYSVRHVPFLSLVGAPLLADQAEDLRGHGPVVEREAGRRSPRALQAATGIALAALLVAIGVRVYRVGQGSARVEETKYPAAALAYMQQHGIDGRIFNTYHWGGYLIWHGYQVFVDGRAELYGDQVLGEYLKAHGIAADWEAPLRKYGVDVVLIEANSRLAVVLQESGRWEAVYRDNLAVVFVPAGEVRGNGNSL